MKSRVRGRLWARDDWRFRLRDGRAQIKHRELSVTLRDDVPSGTNWPFVRTMVEREVVLSTNDVALELVRARAVALPLAVWAHQQTGGRGRGRHEWWSAAGSLTFTMAIDPEAHGLVPMVLPRVALATAVAVIDAFGEVGFGKLGIGIRWPNDLECGGKKLGGILPEQVEVEGGHRLLIGVGLNVGTDLGRRRSRSERWRLRWRRYRR